MSADLPLKIQLTGTPFRYLQSLDRPTKERIRAKLEGIAADPTNVHLSYPLVGVDKRCTRVGKYRVLFQITETALVVSDIGPRGQIYRKA
jgi:mRNA-degrading endonuclease RelE of RelBE toxin-antitoxin system